MDKAYEKLKKKVEEATKTKNYSQKDLNREIVDLTEVKFATVKLRSHTAKATSLVWVLSISFVLFTCGESESESDIASKWGHDPF